MRENRERFMDIVFMVHTYRNEVNVSYKKWLEEYVYWKLRDLVQSVSVLCKGFKDYKRSPIFLVDVSEKIIEQSIIQLQN